MKYLEKAQRHCGGKNNTDKHYFKAKYLQKAFACFDLTIIFNRLYSLWVRGLLERINPILKSST